MSSWSWALFLREKQRLGEEAQGRVRHLRELRSKIWVSQQGRERYRHSEGGPTKDTESRGQHACGPALDKQAGPMAKLGRKSEINQ